MDEGRQGPGSTTAQSGGRKDQRSDEADDGPSQAARLEAAQVAARTAQALAAEREADASRARLEVDRLASELGEAKAAVALADARLQGTKAGRDFHVDTGAEFLKTFMEIAEIVGAADTVLHPGELPGHVRRRLAECVRREAVEGVDGRPVAGDRFRRFAWRVLEETAWGEADLDGAAVMGTAIETGVVRRVAYDPSLHGDGSRGAEPGEDRYVLAPALSALHGDVAWRLGVPLFQEGAPGSLMMAAAVAFVRERYRATGEGGETRPLDGTERRLIEGFVGSLFAEDDAFLDPLSRLYRSALERAAADGTD